MIVGARMKATAETALATGWHSEAFARTKRVKALSDYLRPAQEVAEEGAAKVLALFRRFAARQEGTARGN